MDWFTLFKGLNNSSHGLAHYTRPGQKIGLVQKRGLQSDIRDQEGKRQAQQLEQAQVQDQPGQLKQSQGLDQVEHLEQLQILDQAEQLGHAQILDRVEGQDHQELEQPEEDVQQQAPKLDGESAHAQSLNPSVFKLLMSEAVSLPVPVSKAAQKKRRQIKPKKVTLWSHLQKTFRTSYSEKSLLLDTSLAHSIADAIADRTESDPNSTVFLDGDGGCCDVTKRLLERRVFPEAKVFVRDPLMQPLIDWALKETLYHVADRISLREINLMQMVAHFMLAGGHFVSSLSEVSSEIGSQNRDEKERGWARKDPPYTLFATSTYSFVKYLTHQCLQRDALLGNSSRGGRSSSWRCPTKR